MVKIENVLVSPINTEKALSVPGKYTFQVHKLASKFEVTGAVKQFYGSDVVKVNMVNLGEKTKKGKTGDVRKRAPFKKAVVTLKAGQTLNFNDYK